MGRRAGHPLTRRHFQVNPARKPDILLTAQDLGKCYTLWRRPGDRVWVPLLRRLAGNSLVRGRWRRILEEGSAVRAREFHALREISFTVQRGQSLGVIGRNGAGKSTLLQILAGTLQPSTGAVEVRGRVAALLELGSGFNGDFSGRENVFVQGALAGLSRADIEERFQEVVDFAEIGDFIDQPVKVYSTGMMLRLAFATQTVLDPEIFLVDEALAVGDVFFTSKCVGFFEERLHRGMSLILVSHDIPAVKALCDQVMVLEAGRMLFLGDSSRAESLYHEIHERMRRREVEAEDASAKLRAAPDGAVNGKGDQAVEDSAESVSRNWTPANEIGSKEAEIVHLSIRDKQGKSRLSFYQDEPIVIEIQGRAYRKLANCHFSLQVSDPYNNVVYGVSTINLGMPPMTLQVGRTYCWETEITGLGLGKFLIDALIFLGDRGDGCPLHHVHRVGGIGTVTVGQRGPRPKFLGLADLRAKIALKTTAVESESGATM